MTESLKKTALHENRSAQSPGARSRPDHWFSKSSRGSLALLLAVFVAFSMWFFVDRIWAPPGEMHFSDLYPRWYGSRELLLHGRDPYSPSVTREIQLWSYGRAVDPAQPSGPQDEDRFAYPVYIAFLLAPTITLQFEQVQILFRYLLPVVVTATIALWLAMVNWRPSRPLLGAVFVLSFCSFPVLESLYLQQPGLLAAGLLAGAGMALTRNRLAGSGVLLALSTIKPQLTGLVAVWLLFWAVSDWRHRKHLALGFAATFFILLAIPEALVPRWVPEFLAGIHAYARYTYSVPLLSLWLSPLGGAVTRVGLLAAVSWVAWRWRSASCESEQLKFVFCLMLAVTLLISPSLYPTTQVVLLPGMFLILKHTEWILQQGKWARLAYVAAGSVIGWSYFGAVAFLVALLVVPLARLREFWIFPLSTTLEVPVAIAGVLAITTVKYQKSAKPGAPGII